MARGRWLAVGVVVLCAAVAIVEVTGMRPAYDAYGWLVWGRQAAHLRLDTSAAPSWKPLSFLFTFLYTLVAGRGALWLWMVTSVAGALASAVFAARIAYALAGRPAVRGYAASVAAVFAGLGLLGMEDYWQLILSTTCDGMVVALCLAAVDRQLAGQPRQAWVLLVLACLGRPEAWPLALLYGLWAARANRRMRARVAVGLGLIPVLWFTIPAVTSHSWFISGDVALDSWGSSRMGGLARVADGFVSLYGPPIWVGALFALLLAVVLRERRWLVLAGAAVLWLVVEAAFALHGWSGDRRFMFVPAAIAVILAGAGVGRLLTIAPRRSSPLFWAAVAAVVGLAIALAPPARTNLRLAHTSVILVRSWARQLKRLHAVIAEVGGPKRILSCGQAVTEVTYQSILAWELDENVVDVGWEPERWEKADKPIVLFQPRGAGWTVRPIHTPADKRPACRQLASETP